MNNPVTNTNLIYGVVGLLLGLLLSSCFGGSSYGHKMMMKGFDKNVMMDRYYGEGASWDKKIDIQVAPAE